MRYTIFRENWSDRTYNGHEDSPYWYISISNREIGLKDDGDYWAINNLEISESVKEDIKNIITECKLNIKIN